MSNAGSKLQVGISRRATLKGIGGVGLVATEVLGSGARSARAATSLVSWCEEGERFSFVQQALYPLFEKNFPDIHVIITSNPVGDFLAKVAVVMATRTSRYDVICEDYQYIPQFVAEGAAVNLEPYLAKDPAYRADILADIPQNVLDLYRDKPLKEGGQLYGLPNDSNVQMQYYRKDIFDKLGLKPPETWDDALEVAKVLTHNAKRKVVGTTMRRGFFAGCWFITLLRSYGGDWFNKMGPGGWEVTLDTEEGHKAMDMLMKLNPYMEPTSFNASDDEANTAMLNGVWQYAPDEWGGSPMTDPKFTKFAHDWAVDKSPKGSGPLGRSAGHMGGCGFFIPSYSKHREEAWEYVKFQCSGNKQYPGIGKIAVENTGQPARLSLLREYAYIQPYFAGMVEALPFAIRFPPIPESGSLYELVGNEISAVATAGKSPDQALKDMQAAVTKRMREDGYYRRR